MSSSFPKSIVFFALLCFVAAVFSSSRAAAGDQRLAKPAPSTQVQKSAAERGINPCNTPDPGFGVYTRWSRAPAMGQMILPQRGGVTSGSFDLMIHFHGHEPIRKEWVQAMQGAVLVGIDLGVGSGPYERAFQTPERFGKLVQSVEKAVAAERGLSRARARHIGLSSWSAGYGAIQNILRYNHRSKIDSIILLDGLHSGYSGSTLKSAQLSPFVDFAKRAARGETFMFVSHSSIVPTGYASTTETAHYLVQQLGGRYRKARPRSGDPMGLDLLGRFDRGNFHVRGYSGNGKLDHCAHIGLFRDVLTVHIKPRWRSPQGRAAR